MLTVKMISNPSPLLVSDSNNPFHLGTIDFIITNNSIDPLLCESIYIFIPQGYKAKDLTSNPIHFSVKPSNKWEISDTGIGKLKVIPKHPFKGELKAESLIVSLFDIQVNGFPGNCKIDCHIDYNNTYCEENFIVNKMKEQLESTVLHQSKINSGHVLLQWQGPSDAFYELGWTKGGIWGNQDVTGEWNYEVQADTNTFIVLKATGPVNGKLTDVYRTVYVWGE
ncbi:hypothetical protein [Bacillus thuringiensis]|uniref:hypothetical protein n=1 Tax=Bacillus thuringiensis TaxID=1428 RepID=UPI000BEBCED4|nr:hypothetical protein [Bacillus thuringiensis]MED2871335.1 hypothetical protein [Bacillus thuringiensis]PDY60336.1 hypothetical protein COM87_07625 [Bacillus thuringiensis]PFV76924.1 hypothetical protein COL02_17595 [Bacillus thuringiensis]